MLLPYTYIHISIYPRQFRLVVFFIRANKEAFFLLATVMKRTTVCLLSTTTLCPAAAPRGYHFEIIIEIQFDFVNGDRDVLHLDSWACLMWSSAASLSVASLSLNLLSPTSPDRRASHSCLKGQIPTPLLSVRFLSKEKFTHSVPSPTLWLLIPPTIPNQWTQSGLNKQRRLSLVSQVCGT